LSERIDENVIFGHQRGQLVRIVLIDSLEKEKHSFDRRHVNSRREGLCLRRRLYITEVYSGAGGEAFASHFQAVSGARYQFIERRHEKNAD
jgi:hypothetical protein